MVVHVYNPHTWGAEAGGLKVSGQPGLHNETLSSKEKDRVTERKGGKEREREEEERRGEKRREEKRREEKRREEKRREEKLLSLTSSLAMEE
jgi:hypothetical protein